MKKILLFVSFVAIIFSLNAQVTITSSEMPAPGASYVVSNAISISNYSDAGANLTWDFSALTPLSQDTLTYETPISAVIPITYIATFNNPFDMDHKATTAKEENLSVPVPGITVSDVYFFYKLGTSDYRQVGMGANISGAALPVKMDPTDRVFVLPLNYNDKDTSVSFFEATIPTIGYYSSQKTRYNHADAYGTLKTPYGTFQTLRVKSTCNYHDSLYSEQMGMGFPNDRQEVEYKWMVQGYKIPMITVTERTPAVSVVYIDSLRNIGISEESVFAGIVFPNPATGTFTVMNPDPCGFTDVHVYSSNGQMALWEHIDMNSSSRVINIESLSPGIYSVVIHSQQHQIVRKLVVE